MIDFIRWSQATAGSKVIEKMLNLLRLRSNIDGDINILAWILLFLWQTVEKGRKGDRPQLEKGT